MFLVLGKNNVISKELAEKLAKMARFRNFLIHGYGDVNAEYLLKIINEDLQDIVNFMKEIKTYMKSL